MTCPAAEGLIARSADDPASLSTAERQRLEVHLAQCDSCRALLEDQRHVARLLRARPPLAVPPAFAARVSARLDAEQGWLGLGNWRWWTAALAPVAAGLVFVAWMGGAPGAPAPAVPDDTFDAWVISSGADARAAVFLQSSTGDVLLEAVLTGAPAGDLDAR